MLGPPPLARPQPFGQQPAPQRADRHTHVIFFRQAFGGQSRTVVGVLLAKQIQRLLPQSALPAAVADAATQAMNQAGCAGLLEASPRPLSLAVADLEVPGRLGQAPASILDSTESG